MAGETFRICPNISGEIRITGNGAKHIKMLSAGLYELTLGNGEEVTFSSAASGNGPFVVEPVADPVPYCFGLP